MKRNFGPRVYGPLAIALFVCVAVSVLFIAPPKIQKFIDLNSGEIRTDFIFFGILLDRKIEDTDFSLIVKRAGLDSSPAAWHIYSEKKLLSDSPSPTYRYAGVVSDVNMLALELKLYNVESIREDEICRHAMGYLSQGVSFKLEAEDDSYRLIECD